MKLHLTSPMQPAFKKAGWDINAQSYTRNSVEGT